MKFTNAQLADMVLDLNNTIGALTETLATVVERVAEIPVRKVTGAQFGWLTHHGFTTDQVNEMTFKMASDHIDRIKKASAGVALVTTGISCGKCTGRHATAADVKACFATAA